MFAQKQFDQGLQSLLKSSLIRVYHVCSRVGWLVGCFGFNGPLRQYFSLYWTVSQREGERGERIDESKNVQTTPTITYCKHNRPLPYCNQNCRTPRHWKFTQHHRTTRPPPLLKRSLMRPQCLFNAVLSGLQSLLKSSWINVHGVLLKCSLISVYCVGSRTDCILRHHCHYIYGMYGSRPQRNISF